MRAANGLLRALVFVLTVLACGWSAVAQGPAKRDETSVAYVPGDAWFTLVLRPRAMLEKYEKRVEGPVDLMLRSVQENSGFPLTNLDEFVMVIGFNAAEVRKEGLDEHEQRDELGPDRWSSMIMRFREPVKAEDLKMFGEHKPAEHKGRKYFLAESEWQPSYWMPDDRTLVAAADRRLKSIMDAPDAGMSALLHQLRRADPTADGVLVVSMETGRAFLDSIFELEKPPLVLRPVLDLPKHLDVAVITADLASDQPLKLNALAVDETSAKILTSVADEFVKTMKTMLNGNREDIIKSSARPRMGKLAVEVSEKLISGIELKQDGRKISGQVTAERGLVSVADLVVETFAESDGLRRRYERMAELRLIGSAIQMYQEAHDGRLPPAASFSKDGKPLLSWRVHILPYLDGGKELYEQFKLDEPWDSEHNKKLLDKMPKSFAYDKMPGGTHTRYLAVIGEGTAMQEKESVKPEDIKDATHQTIFVAESPAKQAVPWTKPADLKADGIFDVLTSGAEEDAYFLVLSADGDANFVRKSKITAKALQDFLSTSGGGKEMDIYEFSH